MEKAWKYVEEHHGEYGVALFVIPFLLGAYALLGIGWFLAWIFG